LPGLSLKPQDRLTPALGLSLFRPPALAPRKERPLRSCVSTGLAPWRAL
jgi:hypothetical protein